MISATDALERTYGGSETKGTSRQSVAGALLLSPGLDELDQRTHPKHALAAADSYPVGEPVEIPAPRSQQAPPAGTPVKRVPG